MADSIDLKLGRHAVALANQEWGGLKPLGPAFESMMDQQPEPMCRVDGNWYVVSVEMRQFDRMKHEVAIRGPVPYLPMEPRRERHGRGRMRTVYRPLLGPYMLVRCLPYEWSGIMAARGVRRFLGSNGEPVAIGNAEVEVIRLFEAEKEEEERQRSVMDDVAARAREGGRSGIIWHFSEGDRVRIKNGPFAGFYAALEAAVDVHDRVRALIDIFGRESPTELSAFDIEGP